MKGIVTAFILVVTSFTIQGQIGFNKKFNLGRSNAFLGSAINDDTLLVLGATTDFVNGWQFSAIAIDTNGIIINDNKYEKDSFQLLSWGGYNSKLLISDSIGKNIAIIDESHRRELQIYFFDNDGKIRKKNIL
jgi:hypothetical protein